MGQKPSNPLQEYLPSFITHLFSEESSNSLISEEISSMTYKDFLNTLGKLNQLSQTFLGEQGYGEECLVFAVKGGSDSSQFWKATVKIACVKLKQDRRTVESYGLLTLSQFLKVYKTLQCQYNAREQSKSVPIEDLSFLSDLSDQFSLDLCCICLERMHDTMLPCAHSFCEVCFKQWRINNQTCPICRETLESLDEAWVISEPPTSTEISDEISDYLSKLSKTKPKH